MKFRQRKVKLNCKIPKKVVKFEVKFDEDNQTAISICNICAALFALFLLVTVCLRAVAYYEDFYGDKTIAQIFTEFNQHFGDVLEVVDLHTYKDETDYFENQINSRLRPIQSRLAELRAELLDHDAILYIHKLSLPPFDFIHDTKLELENLGLDLLELDTEARAMLGEMQRKSEKTAQLAARLLRKIQKIRGLSAPWKLNLARKEGIFFVPIKWVSELGLSGKELEGRILKEGKNKNQSNQELVEEIVETRKVLGNLEQLFLKRDQIEKEIFSLMGKKENQLSALTRDKLLDKAYDECDRDLFFVDGQDLIFEHDSMENEITETIKGSEKFLHNVLLLEWKTSLKIIELAADDGEHSEGKIQFLKLKKEIEKELLKLLWRVEKLGQSTELSFKYDY